MKIFDFDEVQLLPKRCIVDSRSECKTSVKLGNNTFKIPVVPANMTTIIDEDLAIELAKKKYFYIMHRFNVDNIAFIKKAKKNKVIASISIGVKQKHYDEIEEMAKKKIIPDYITIDIAHGHANSVRRIIKFIREKLGNNVFIIAGNVATPDAVSDLERWGADATKIGVGPGKVCITRLKTGFGTANWQLSAIKWCNKAASKPMIADGGIRHNGDIAKAIRFGASMVMAGSLLSGHKESPGKEKIIDGKTYKEYYGSASKYNKSVEKYVEGKKLLVPLKGSIWDTLKFIRQDLQSAISYAGGKDLNALQHVSYILLTNNEGY